MERNGTERNGKKQREREKKEKKRKNGRESLCLFFPILGIPIAEPMTDLEKDKALHS